MVTQAAIDLRECLAHSKEPSGWIDGQLIAQPQGASRPEKARSRARGGGARCCYELEDLWRVMSQVKS